MTLTDYIDKIRELDILYKDYQSRCQYTSRVDQSLERQVTIISNEIKKVKEQAKEELGEYAYYANPVICGVNESTEYFSDNEFRKLTLMVGGQPAIMYYLKYNFDWVSGHEFLSNIGKHLECNATYNDKPSVEIGIYPHDLVYNSDDDCYITFCNDEWIIRIDEDVLFESSSCQSAIEYLNLIR